LTGDMLKHVPGQYLTPPLLKSIVKGVVYCNNLFALTQRSAWQAGVYLWHEKRCHETQGKERKKNEKAASFYILHYLRLDNNIYDVNKGHVSREMLWPD